MSVMMVEKWVAGFSYHEDVIVVRALFRKTAKMMIFECQKANEEEDKARMVLRYKARFTQREAKERLFDTPQEALDALHQRREEVIEGWEQRIEAARTQQKLIDDFEVPA